MIGTRSHPSEYPPNTFRRRRNKYTYIPHQPLTQSTEKIKTMSLDLENIDLILCDLHPTTGDSNLDQNSEADTLDDGAGRKDQDVCSKNFSDGHGHGGRRHDFPLPLAQTSSTLSRILLPLQKPSRTFTLPKQLTHQNPTSPNLKIALIIWR